jgi:hypothetical protein
MDQHDKNESELAVRYGFRLLSAYRLSTGKKIWIITEADRSCTTILLPKHPRARINPTSGSLQSSH